MATDNSHEIQRLAENQRALLDAMPEMVLLVNIGQTIEYMNPSAITFFGDLCYKNKTTPQENLGLYKQLIALVESSAFFLVEKMAEEIAAICLENPKVDLARVRVEKPGAVRFSRSVGIEIERVRE